MIKRILLITLLISSFFFVVDGQNRRTENLVIVTLDGFRWQEVFKGADFAIINNNDFTKDRKKSREQYWDDDVLSRRELLMPFLWKEIKEGGQIHGNRGEGSEVNCKNAHWGSYMGYSEMFTGFADNDIYTNGYPANPNINVLEFINQQEGFKDRLAVFTSWDAFSRILNRERNHLMISSGPEKVISNQNNAPLTKLQQGFNQYTDLSLSDYRSDAATFVTAFEYMKVNHPRLMYFALGDTDEMGHAGDYGAYLDAAHHVDMMLKELWHFIQSDPQYKNKTTLFVTTDHGRGLRDHWTSHGAIYYLEHSKEIWFAVIGPDTPPGGEVKQKEIFFQEQFAQTFAKLLGLSFKTDHPVADPLDVVFNN